MNLAVSRFILGLSLLALLTYTLLSGLEMPFRASMLPVLASSLAIPLTLIAIYVEFKEKNSDTSPSKSSNGDLAVSKNEVSKEAFRRVRYFFLWFGGLLLSAYFFGFLIGLPSMVLLYLMLNRESIKISLILSSTVLAILYFGFQRGLVLPLPKGVLTTMMFGT